MDEGCVGGEAKGIEDGVLNLPADGVDLVDAEILRADAIAKLALTRGRFDDGENDVSNLLRLGAGFLSPRRRMDLRLTRLWLDYTLWTGAIALGIVLALPTLAAMLGARP